ncbi:MAG TPA: hypothetical protein PLY68_09800 [Myxococcota bacterium]|nr:hypothetical protein [Myxococcota bacterium]HNZ03960.1 hypothetical protein [Myxococcota bacterium]HPB51495.1 hypothetical protein [Myxococcota bacterium]HQP96472.1 hypothetical protein [Myxococcota bacterium]
MKHILFSYAGIAALAISMASCGGTDPGDDQFGAGDVADTVQADTIQDGFAPDTDRPDQGAIETVGDPGVHTPPDALADVQPDALADVPPDCLFFTDEYEDPGTIDGGDDADAVDDVAADAGDALDDQDTAPTDCLEFSVDGAPMLDTIVDFGTLVRGKSSRRDISVCNRCTFTAWPSISDSFVAGNSRTLVLESVTDSDGQALALPNDPALLGSWLIGLSIPGGECLTFGLTYDSDRAHTIPSDLFTAVIVSFSYGWTYAVALTGRSVESLPFDNAEDCVQGGNNCHVDGVCYAVVSGPADKQCAVCQPGYSEGSEYLLTNWPADYPCDDGLNSTTNDMCDSGVCAGTPCPAQPLFADIAAGASHACAVDVNGLVYCWGNNETSQCGVPSEDTPSGSTSPTLVTVPASAGKIAAGEFHTCTTIAAGGAWCWGFNALGQLGAGNMNSTTTPIQVTSLNVPLQQITAGRNHTCALTGEGQVFCWGAGDAGQLGTGSTHSPTPAQVPLPTAIHIAAGNNHTCAVLQDGSVACWGDNAFGQTSRDDVQTVTAPVTISSITGAIQVAAGRSHSCALLDSGMVTCWGDAGFGQRGDGHWSVTRSFSTKALIENQVVVEAAGNHTCSTNAAGGVSCWGENEGGCFGNRSILDSAYPVHVLGLWQPASSFATGDDFACAALEGGGLRCWGSNAVGQLGNYLYEDESLVPVEVIWADNT